ncbi:Y phosphatase-domain-containing protein, partial [Teratosphaeria destructans]
MSWRSTPDGRHDNSTILLFPYLPPSSNTQTGRSQRPIACVRSHYLIIRRYKLWTGNIVDLPNICSNKPPPVQDEAGEQSSNQAIKQSINSIHSIRPSRLPPSPSSSPSHPPRSTTTGFPHDHLRHHGPRQPRPPASTPPSSPPPPAARLPPTVPPRTARQVRRPRMAAAEPPAAGTQAADRPFARLTGDAVAARNRYLNVEPYADNRVKLNVAHGANDYINASPIVLGTRRYIATQGPKDTSVNHFYRMLADDHVVRGPVVVVMLTQTHEAGARILPARRAREPAGDRRGRGDGDGFHGHVLLDAASHDPDTRSEIRHLRLRTRMSRGDDQDPAPREKEIHHLLFSGWPDFLVPEGPDRRGLLALIHLSAALNRPPT